MVTGCSELTRAEYNNVQKRNYAILVGPVEGWFDHSKYGTGRFFLYFFGFYTLLKFTLTPRCVGSCFEHPHFKEVLFISKSLK